MSNTVSIIMPTRNSREMLRQALTSIRATASDMSRVEILLRIDDDFQERINEIPALEKEFGARCVVGPRGAGYINMGQFVDDLVAIATGQWSWLFDDDAWLIGDSWQQQLDQIEPTMSGPVCAAEWYTLGGSQYSYAKKFSPPGLIMPTVFVKNLKHRNPVDDQWLSETRRLGWKEVPLSRVEYCHFGRLR